MRAATRSGSSDYMTRYQFTLDGLRAAALAKQNCDPLAEELSAALAHSKDWFRIFAIILVCTAPIPGDLLVGPAGSRGVSAGGMPAMVDRK